MKGSSETESLMHENIKKPTLGTHQIKGKIYFKFISQKLTKTNIHNKPAKKEIVIKRNVKIYSTFLQWKLYFLLV